MVTALVLIAFIIVIVGAMVLTVHLMGGISDDVEEIEDRRKDGV